MKKDWYWYCFSCDKWLSNEETKNEPITQGANINSNYCKKCETDLGIFQTKTECQKDGCRETIKISGTGKNQSKEFSCPIHNQQHRNNRDSNNSKQGENGSPNGFNWKPWVIGGGVILLAIIGLAVYLFTRRNKKSES